LAGFLSFVVMLAVSDGYNFQILSEQARKNIEGVE
jgi:hypothetical protein